MIDTLEHLIGWLNCEPSDDLCNIGWMRTIVQSWTKDRTRIHELEAKLQAVEGLPRYQAMVVTAKETITATEIVIADSLEAALKEGEQA